MNDLVDDLFRRTSGHIVSTLTRILGPRHLALAEEVTQDALVTALQTWPFDGVPANPSAWLTQVAKHRALDRLRRDRWLADRAPLLAALDAVPPPDAHLRGEPAMPDDDGLAMMFLSCHPSLPREARVALTLKIVCAFGVGEIARALLSSEDAIVQRLVRAKRQLRDEDVAFDLQPTEYAARLASVLDVLYLLFNQGYTAHAGEDLIRAELCTEAVRLTSLVAHERTLVTPAVHALLALMLLQAARLPTRVGDAANLLRIDEQDRARWDQTLIARGLEHLDRSAAGESLTPYHLEAGIAACHTAAARYEDTDWARIVELYDLLAASNPTPVVLLNRAIAISRVRRRGGPFRARRRDSDFTIEGRTWPDGRSPLLEERVVRGAYFEAMGVRLVRGRLFTERDNAGAPKVVIVNDTVARRFFPNEDAVGKRLTFYGSGGPLSEIVGVVASVRSAELSRQPLIEAYAPDVQYPASTLTFVVRTTAEPAALTAAIRQEIASIDPLQPLSAVRTMEEVVRTSTAQPRLLSTLTVLFAMIAALLAAVGTYGIMAYSVSQQTREIGIRMAMGADASAGVTLGALGAIALTGVLTSMLYEVSPTDPAVFAATCAGVVVVALAACYVPARSATRVDPMVVLREL